MTIKTNQAQNEQDITYKGKNWSTYTWSISIIKVREKIHTDFNCRIAKKGLVKSKMESRFPLLFLINDTIKFSSEIVKKSGEQKYNRLNNYTCSTRH
jgi:hypothetical protein